MATIYKTDKGWRAQVCVKGRRVSKVLASKTQAKAWAVEMEVELAGGKTIAASNRTVGDLFQRYRTEVSPTKKGAKWEEKKFRSWEGSLLSKVFVDDLDATHIAAWRDQRLKEVMASTVNRELNLISAVFTRSIKEWRWLKTSPVTEVRRPKNPKHRDRRVSESEIQQILEGLGFKGEVVSKSTLLAVYFLFALETAMRLGEICALREGDIFNDHVVIRDSKNGDKRYIPLSMKARELVQLMRGHTIGSDSASVLFRRVTRKLDIEDLHFHDTRHEACTRLARKLDVLDLARMIGHRDLKSLMIYYNATPSELASRLG